MGSESESRATFRMSRTTSIMSCRSPASRTSASDWTSTASHRRRKDWKRGHPPVFAELIRRGYTDEQLKGIAGKQRPARDAEAEAVAARQKEKPPSDASTGWISSFVLRCSELRKGGSPFDMRFWFLGTLCALARAQLIVGTQVPYPAAAFALIHSAPVSFINLSGVAVTSGS